MRNKQFSTLNCEPYHREQKKDFGVCKCSTKAALLLCYHNLAFVLGVVGRRWEPTARWIPFFGSNRLNCNGQIIQGTSSDNKSVEFLEIWAVSAKSWLLKNEVWH